MARVALRRNILPMHRADSTDSILSSPIDSLDGVGPARAKQLCHLGIKTVGDLLDYFPRSYQAERAEGKIDSLGGDAIQTARGEVCAVDYIAARPRSRFEATIDDGTGKLALVWFNGAYLRRAIHPGQMLRVRGKVKRFHNMPQMTNPKWETIEPGADAIESASFRAIYPASADLSSETIGRLIHAHLAGAVAALQEWFDSSLLQRRQLLPRSKAYQLIHDPASAIDAQLARRRLVYDELMLLQLGLTLSKRTRVGRLSAPVMRVDKLLDERIRKRFPFTLTSAQQQAIHQITLDLRSGRAMNRLLQGDVGSGKTVVALYAMLVAVANRMQAAILAPTEVLAEQHYLTLSRLLAGSSVQIDLFTSRSKRNARGQLLKRLAGGQTHLAVGTQALIQEDIAFANLGIVVVDEQHKLGVKQRALLREMGHLPHSLVMTATPIPRSLALSYFADFELSVIDELPPGRQPIQTRWLRRHAVATAYDLIRAEVSRERQAFVVVPQIEDNGIDDSKSVIKEFQRLSTGPLAGLRLAILHGQMSTDEKQQTMAAFSQRRADVLVATTVIEVGIDIPAATVMVIENADSFGLSQLHQLRGRVGRGTDQSHCILVSDTTSEPAMQRLRAMTETTDGFRIAELDLMQRGPGDFFGTRQHGLPQLKLADITQEVELLKTCRDDAIELLAADPNLSAPQHADLRRALAHRFGETLGLAQIG